MMERRAVWRFALAAMAAFWVSASAQDQPAGPIAGGPYSSLVVRSATLLDGTGAPPAGPVDIVIEHNVITRVVRADPVSLARAGGEAARPTGDRVIDATGSFVMPGLIDLHTHIGDLPAEYYYHLWLGHGVTAIRIFSMGRRSLEEMVAERERARSATAPRIAVYPFWRGDDPRFDTPDGARAVVREWKQKGADGIKISAKPGLHPDVLQAVADEAGSQGMGVAVHIGQDGVLPMHAVEVARAGVTTIEHFYGYAEAAFSDRTVQNLARDYNYLDELQRFRAVPHAWLETDVRKLHGEVIDALVEESRHGRFVMVPTFAVYEDLRDLTRAQRLPWLERFTMPQILQSWLPNPETHGSIYTEWTTADEAAWQRMYRRWMDFVNEFKNRGGRVAVGSDAGTTYHLYGFDTIRELELLQHAGFHPLEVARAAGEHSAQAFGQPRLGVIRAGHLADLMIVEANPLADLKPLYGAQSIRFGETGEPDYRTAIRHTIRDGVVFEARALLAQAEEMVRRANQTAQPTTR